MFKAVQVIPLTRSVKSGWKSQQTTKRLVSFFFTLRVFIKFPLRHKAFSLSGANWNHIKCLHRPHFCANEACDISKETLEADSFKERLQLNGAVLAFTFSQTQSLERQHVRNRNDETKCCWEMKINMLKFSTNYCCSKQLKLVFWCTYLLCTQYG